MSTIDEVLAAAEVVDAVCVIDGETRIISVPTEYKELGVESDEKVTRVKFQCPKIVGDNIDLTEYNLYINYKNAGNKLNSYLVEDVTVVDNIINFSWLLSRHVTESPGTINYIVCAKKSDDTGVINEWNTKVATGTVGIGLEATEEIEEQNIDAIEQILRSIVELENKVDSGGGGGSGIVIDETLTAQGKAADAKATGDAINLLSEEIANLNTNGISATARNLLITILRNGVYISDQKANITDLETALGGSGAPVVKSYAIINTLTNCTTNNAATSVTDGDSYTATLTAADGYALNSVVVTMGGTDITSTAYSGSVITIASVTGDVSIVATAVATESGGSETVVNLFDKNTMVITGYFWGTNGAPNSNAGSKYVKVPVEAGKTYAIQKSGTYDKSQWNAGGNGMVSWVSADGTVLSAAINTNALNAHIDPNSKGVVTIIAPDGVVYICFSVKVFENGIDYTDTTMVEEGDTCHDYVAYA